MRRRMKQTGTFVDTSGSSERPAKRAKKDDDRKPPAGEPRSRQLKLDSKAAVCTKSPAKSPKRKRPPAAATGKRDAIITSNVPAFAAIVPHVQALVTQLGMQIE